MHIDEEINDVAWPEDLGDPAIAEQPKDSFSVDMSGIISRAGTLTGEQAAKLGVTDPMAVVHLFESILYFLDPARFMNGVDSCDCAECQQPEQPE